MIASNSARDDDVRRRRSGAADTDVVQSGHSSTTALTSFDDVVEKLPKGVTLTRMGSSILLRYRWLGWRTLAIGLAALIWNAVTMPKLLAKQLPDYLTITFAAVGALVFYRTLVDLLNSTTVDVSPGEIVVRHGPLPFKRGVTISARTLKQLHVRTRVSQKSNGGQTVAYDLAAEQHGDVDVVLVKNLESAAVGLILEQHIEEHFGIKDAPDRG